MHFKILKPLAVMTALFLGFSAPGAIAQTAAANILVVDMMRIQEQSAAAKAVQTQIRDYETKFQAQIKSAEEKIKAEEVGLKQQQTLLAPDAFDAKRREFETKVGSEQRRLQQSQQDFQTAVRNAQSTLLKALQPILKDLMTERGANMIVDRRMVMVSSDSLDVTAAVIEQLNKKLPSIKVEMPKKQ